MINICKENNWSYIFTLKKNRLKKIYEEFQDNVNYENEVSISNYSLSSNIEFNGNLVNAFSYEETIGNKTTTFNYITNLRVKDSNIAEIVNIGRKRWKIENEDFNEQKMVLTI